MRITRYETKEYLKGQIVDIDKSADYIEKKQSGVNQ